MIYLLILASITFYLSMTHITYKHIQRIWSSYFGDNKKRDGLFISFFWPISLPAFYVMHHDVVQGVRRGQDWADVNLPEARREPFRDEFMRARN